MRRDVGVKERAVAVRLMADFAQEAQPGVYRQRALVELDTLV